MWDNKEVFLSTVGFRLNSYEHQNKRELIFKPGSHTAGKWSFLWEHLVFALACLVSKLPNFFSLVKNFKTCHTAEVDYFVY